MTYIVRIHESWVDHLRGNKFIAKDGQLYIIGGVRPIRDGTGYELYFIPASPFVWEFPTKFIN